uniref:SH3 domain-binding glutamic acid-rich-like protein 2 n=1 Tax=Sinocyclocheilus grahami TaxID=75366 RepID=A0A672NC92_SINGR
IHTKSFIVFCVKFDVKKRQQAIVGFLEANRISFEEVDITMLEDQRLWMYRNIPEEKRPEKGNPLPPQIFNGDDYCGVSDAPSPIKTSNLLLDTRTLVISSSIYHRPQFMRINSFCKGFC